MSFPSSSSSSSVPSSRGWTYDVFLSFRGKDTRNNFVDHLYENLVQKGIHVFKDDKRIRKGKPISPELLKAIEESRFALVVISENYANSSWCLDELVKIMECMDQIGQKVLPVFYHVEPTDVRKQKGTFATSFEQHNKKFIVEDKVIKWRKALTAVANLSAYLISAVSGGESDIIKNIIQEILGNIQPHGNENNLIGIESRMEALKLLLKFEATKEVLMIGIFGMGGIGKTTIAQALFRRIAYKFEGCSFVNDVRENSTTKNDICALQEKILRDILVVDHGFKIQDPEYGANVIQERISGKKVLLVLDDVDNFQQLEFLAERVEWFGPGSRIIITTRNEHLLSDANFKYKPSLLLMDQALELFSRYAFRENSPPNEFKELSNRVIRCTGRLPLALKIVGSFLRKRQVSAWESALDRLATMPMTKITDKLKLSFDDLEVSEKNLFLDIACFFKGKEVKDVTRILDSFDYYPGIGIDVLIEKSLITVSYEKLHMHDLIQEMGWNIARESSQNVRLWQHGGIHDFIRRNKELTPIEAIVEPWQTEKLGFSANIFESMSNLRLLDVNWNFTSQKPTFLPNALRWLSWNQYPFSSLPLEQMHKLVGFELSYGRIEHLWQGQKVMPNLKFIRLHDLSSLTRLPDVSGAPNIERLVVSNCKNMVEVDESLGSHLRLVCLDMINCSNLKRLPSKFEMKSLELLILINCCSLERFPEFSPCMVKLSCIDFYGCHGVQELPSSIGYLSNLQFLNLEACTGLTKISNSICDLKSLKRLSLHDCQKLQRLPEEFGRMANLEELQLGSNDFFTPFEGQAEFISFNAITNLLSLRKLDLSWRQIGDYEFPKNFHGLSSLEELHLSRNSKLTQLPVSISYLSRLKHLELDECSRLQNLHPLPLGLQVLKASGCSSMKKIEDLSKEYENLYMIWLLDCQKLLEDQTNKRYLDKMLNQSFLKKWAAIDGCSSIAIPGSKIPDWFKEQQNGHKIALKLPPKWQTQIMGFAICGVFMQPTIHAYHSIDFRFENEGMFVPKSEIAITNDPTTNNGNLWIGYIPFRFFQQMHDHDFQHDDWSNIIEGNLVVTVNLSYHKAVRCGAMVVYKEDVELVERIKPHNSNYWSWDLVYRSQNTILCR